MSFKNTLFMALVLLLVALFIFRFEIPEEERKERETHVLRTAVEQQVARIAVTGATGNYVFVRTGSGASTADKNELPAWQLEGLPDAKLDASAVAALSEALQKFKSDSILPASEVSSDLSVYGLDNSPLTIEVGTGDHKTTIAFGKKNDFIEKRYARISAGAQSDIALTDEVLFKAASKPLNDFREKNPLQFTDGSIKSVAGEWSGARFVLEQGEVGWSLKQPVDVAAEEEPVLTIIRELRGLRVAEYIDGVTDLATYHLTQPEATYQISFKDEKRKPVTVTLSTGPANADGKGESAYLSLGGSTVYKTASNPLPKLQVSASFFRNRRLFAFEVDDTHKVVIARSGAPAGEEKTVIEARGPVWNVNGAEGDPVFVLQYLNDISYLEATDFPSAQEKQFGFEKPSVTFEVSISGKDKKELTRTLVVGNSTKIPSGGEGFYAADKDHMDLPFILSSASLQKLLPKVEALKKSTATPAAL